MAFSSVTRTKRPAGGGRFNVTGTWANTDGSTGGTITGTGLTVIEHVSLTKTGAAVGTNDPAVNGTFPISGSSFVLVTDADQSGSWQAYGY